MAPKPWQYVLALLTASYLSACGHIADERSATKIVSGKSFRASNPINRHAVSIETWDNSSQTKGSCSGVLVSATWVLTAAHCKASSYNVIAFEGSLPSTGDARPSSQSFVPEGPMTSVSEMLGGEQTQALNDLMLIKLGRPLPSDGFERSALLSGAEAYLLPQTLWAVGSGQHNGGPNPSKDLQWVEVKSPVFIPWLHAIFSSQVQTDLGDSGGGLYRPVGRGQNFELVGILSGVVRGESVWTHIGSYREWIQQTISESP